MRILLDTHLLLWAADAPERLPEAARAAIADVANIPVFSVASIWEVAIKQARRRADFDVDVRRWREGMLAAGYEELPILGSHAVALDTLPGLHKDPFDRLLVAQAIVEGIILMTSDAFLGRYPGPIRPV